jgi:DNA-directed RNA polymerase specialized sigma24 family protein
VDVSFGEFIAARIAIFRRFGLLLAGNPHDGDDLAQAALLRVGVRWSRIDRSGYDISAIVLDPSLPHR